MPVGSHLRLPQAKETNECSLDRLRAEGLLRSLLGSIENRCEEDVEQHLCKNTPLAKTLADLKPSRHPSPIQSYARSHPIVELAHDIDHHRRHPKPRKNNPEKGACLLYTSPSPRDA